MRTLRDGSCIWYILTLGAIVAPLIALIASCASSALPAPHRTYDRIPAAELYLMIEGVLVNAGFKIFQRDRHRGFLQTSWKESELEKDGAPAGQERRMFSVFINADYDQQRVYITSIVEERSHQGRDWNSKEFMRDRDAEYARLLREFDRAVQQREVGPTRRGRDQRASGDARASPRYVSITRGFLASSRAGPSSTRSPVSST